MRFDALTNIVAGLMQPVPGEMRTLLARRWDSLPDSLRNGMQALGRDLVHCGFTLGPAYCSFGCTHCYLPRNANRTPLPSAAEMREQIRANRRLIGPGGGLQITGGDVIDAYWRAGRAEELIDLVRYANDVGVVPMVMTHGQRLLDHPAYLLRLVRAGGLRKVGLHIDMTQAGRPGFPIRAVNREADLDSLREAFVRLILSVRRQSGSPLSAAHLVTVTERNVESLPDILRWLTASPSHLDVFRTLSFQTEADVGRTRMSATPVTPQRVWQQISAGLGQSLPRDGLGFGHPDCTRMTTLLVLFPERRVINLVAGDQPARDCWSRLLDLFGGLGVSGQPRTLAWAKMLGIAVRHPWATTTLAAAMLRRLRRQGVALPELSRLLSGRARGLNLVMHNFMDAAQLAQPRDSVTCDRLAACSFRGAFKRNGRWHAEPMCTMNVEHRESFYATQINTRPAGSQ